jgi:hypothetical protein
MMDERVYFVTLSRGFARHDAIARSQIFWPSHAPTFPQDINKAG